MLFERPVADLGQYEFNMRDNIRLFGADGASADGARYYRPSPEVVEIVDGAKVMVRERRGFRDFIAAERVRRQIEHFKTTGQLPAWIANFLERGDLGSSGSRHNMIFAVAKTLSLFSYDKNKVFDMIKNSPVDFSGGRVVKDAEIMRTVKDAFESKGGPGR
jgi:hypothetical protein